MNKIFDSLKYVRGNDYVLKNGNKVKHFKLSDIEEKYTESTYSSLLTVFCARPFDLVDSLYLMNIRHDSIDKYGLFNLLFYSWYFSEMADSKFVSIINDFLYVKNLTPVEDDNKDIVYIDENFKIILNKDIVNEIELFLKNISNYENAKVEKFANEETREAYIENLIEEKEDDLERGKKRITMANMIGAIVLETSYTYETVFELYMYQFHSCTTAILKRQEWKNIMLGVYTGNIDTKKIDLSKYNWLTN